MKNLQLISNIEYSIDPRAIQLITLNIEGNKRFLYFYTNTEIQSYNTVSGDTNIIYKAHNIKSVEYLLLNNEICVALESGEVILLNPSNKSTTEVSFCQDRIQTMSWSPDQEIVVFVTRAKSMVVMTCSFDPITETLLDDSNSFGAGDFITVGWGKKETQFHGSEGKQAAKLNSDFTIPKNTSELPQEVNISWRGDSEYYAVSFVGINGRMFKVYNKEGILQFTSEKLNDLGVQLAWRPLGTWIAIPHHLPNKYSIGLFEKNGLRHREIILPFKSNEEFITNISWSGDSDILAIETEMVNKTKVYLYTVTNYHWYLKQVLKFDNKILSSFWDLGINEGKTFHILLENGKYLVYRWDFSVTNSVRTSGSNNSVVAVIDGKQLLLSDFQNKVIPPPMSNLKHECASEILFCNFLQYPNTEENEIQLFVLDSEYLCSFYGLKFEHINNINVLKYIQLKNERRFVTTEGYKTNHWLWLNDRYLIFCKNNKLNTTIFLASIIDTDICSKLDVQGIVGEVTSVSKNEFLVHFMNGTVQNMKIDNNEIIHDKCVSNGNIFCEQNQFININTDTKLLSLKSDSNLYVNGINVSSDVTSFFITDHYVAFTKLDCLKFYRLKDEKIVSERKIERGGKIIVIISTDGKTILQMPRGNLETIYPRVLSLTIIGEFLDNFQYDKAMDLLRKERINLNIIFDHNPKKFIDNLDKFLDQITNPQWINLFLSDLQNEDFTQHMYSTNYDQNTIQNLENYCVENKINYVCEKLCNKMEEKNFEQFLLPIITAYVKTGNLEKALDIIWNTKKKEMLNFNDNNQIKSKSEEALKYILYLVNINELFNVALGLYDFGLVLFVANKSQKDPKEYVPFLNELKQYNENYKRYKIDLHLKRFEKALENISKCSNDPEKLEETIDLIEKEELYQKALGIFINNELYYKKISLAFADHLRAKGKFENASIMYERADDLPQAILSAKHILDWQRCLQLTSLLYPGNQEELKKCSLSLVTALETNGRYDDASYLLLFFCENLDEALMCMLRGRLYLKSLFEAKLKKPEFIESHINPHLIKYSEILQANITTDEEIFKKHVLRLEKVRKDKLEKANESIYDDAIDEYDILSEVNSINSSKHTRSSTSTGKTFRSSKNRRKHERKLLSLKEGNPFEDIALIDALHNHITKIVNQQQNIRDTCKALMEIKYDEIARKIQNSFRIVLLLIKNSLDNIWIPDMQIGPQQINTNNNIDYVQYLNEQHYAMLSPLKRYKPQLNITDWEHNILK